MTPSCARGPLHQRLKLHQAGGQTHDYRRHRPDPTRLRFFLWRRTDQDTLRLSVSPPVPPKGTQLANHGASQSTLQVGQVRVAHVTFDAREDQPFSMSAERLSREVQAWLDQLNTWTI